jgi:hypothetical protein
MKTNESNYQLCFLIIVLFITAINLSAQETNTNNRLNFKLGYSKYSNTDFIFYSTNHENDGKGLNEVGNIRLSSNLRINKFIDAGIYFGYSLYETYIPQNFDSLGRPGTLSHKEANSIMYGLNTNIHILPFFIKKDNFRFDLYCSLQYGNIHLFEPEGGINTKRNYQEYGIYGGLAFYPFRHLGLYAEYGYAKYANLRYGLSLKF